jgi:hypothetical protein
MTLDGQTRGSKIWYSIGTARTVRVIFVLMILYFLVIGGLVLGYANVQNCLAHYSDENAIALRIRTQTASDDRALNVRVDEVDTSDRARIIANQKATRDLIEATAKNGGTATLADLRAYQKISDDSLAIFATNENQRVSIRQERARIDAVRSTAPNPDPPSETC